MKVAIMFQYFLLNKCFTADCQLPGDPKLASLEKLFSADDKSEKAVAGTTEESFFRATNSFLQKQSLQIKR